MRASSLCVPHRKRVYDSFGNLSLIIPTYVMSDLLGGSARRTRSDWVHQSDRGSQYVSIRDSERLAEARIEPSVGSRGDRYDKALAETINGLYKAELFYRRAP